MTDGKTPSVGVDRYSLGVTYKQAMDIYADMVQRFSKETGVPVEYDVDSGLLITQGVTVPKADGSSEILLGIGGLAAEDFDEDGQYDADIPEDAPIPDANFVWGTVTLQHELEHAMQNFMEHGKGSKPPDPAFVISSIAFRHNELLYKRSHLNNIRETDADQSGISRAQMELRGRFPGKNTDAMLLHNVNSRWENGRIYRIGQRDRSFKSLLEVRQAFVKKKEDFFLESMENPTNPYGFWNGVELWTDCGSELARTVRSPNSLKARKRWADVFDAIQNAPTCAEFDRRAASVMLYIHPEYKKEFALDGIDLSSRTVFGIDQFPEPARATRWRVHPKKELLWAIRSGIQEMGPDSELEQAEAEFKAVFERIEDRDNDEDGLKGPG